MLSSSLLIIALIGIMSLITDFNQEIGKGRDIRRYETLPTTVHVADYDSLDVLLERVKSTKIDIQCYWDDPKSGNTKVGRIVYWKEDYGGYIFGGYNYRPEAFSFAGRMYYDKKVLIRELQFLNFRIPTRTAHKTFDVTCIHKELQGD